MSEFPGGDNVRISMESARHNADRLGINYGAIPELPFLSRLFGQTSEDYHTKVAAKVMTSSASLGRELTQPEKDAMSYHFGKLIVTLSYGNPIAAVTTVAFLQRTNKTHGFPFWTPKQPKFDPSKFPGLPEGSASRLMWQGVRGLAWISASKVLVTVFMTSYAVSVYSASLRSDPRLESYREHLDSRKAGRRAGQDQRSGAAQDSAERRQPPFSSHGGNPAVAPPPTMEADWERSSQVPTSTWSGMQSGVQSEPAQDPAGQESSVFDDASPVAPSEQQREASQQSTLQGGSAWDRIRNQAQTSRSQTTSWTKKQQDEMTSRGAQQGTSYNYSSADEEKVYAKEQAQREFDEMLEAERRGQSASSGRR